MICSEIIPIRLRDLIFKRVLCFQIVFMSPSYYYYVIMLIDFLWQKKKKKNY